MTDANVVLGHLPPGFSAGDEARRRRCARVRPDDRRRDGLGSAEEAAEGILAIVNENMAGRCASCRCSAVTTRGSSRSSPTAAPGRSTRTRSPRSWARSRCSSRRPRGSCVRSATSWPTSATSSRRRTSACSGGRPGGGRHDPRGARRATAVARQRGHPGRRALDHVHGRHALPPPGLRDPGRDRPRRGEGRPRRARGAVQRPPRAAVRVPHAGHGLRDRQPARDRLGRRPEAGAACRRPGDADASGAVSEEHEIVFKESVCRRRSTTGRSSRRATGSTGRRS